MVYRYKVVCHGNVSEIYLPVEIYEQTLDETWLRGINIHGYDIYIRISEIDVIKKVPF